MTVEEENSMPLIAALVQASARTDDDVLKRFYDWLGKQFSSRDYARIQARYIGNIDPKFLAVCWRTKRLMAVAKWLSWHKKSGLRTLDLGSGSGHMGLIANYFEHESLGLDCAPIFDPLMQFWRQATINHRIEAGMPLPDIGRFHSITSILTNYGRNWTKADWSEFLDLISDHLEPDGEFVIHFPGSPNQGSRGYLRERASRIENDGRFMFFAKD